MSKLKLVFLIVLCVVFFTTPSFAASSSVYTLSEPWVYTITHRTSVTNPSDVTIRDVNISLPFMDHNQPIYQEFLGEELNPPPDRIVSAGQVVRRGVFTIPVLKPRQTVILEQKYAVKNYAIEYTIERSQVSADYQGYKNMSPAYLQPETKIEVDHPAIVKYAKETIRGETNPYVIAQKLFADINLFMTYKEGPNANKGALNALRYGEGVCEDYTALFVASTRALGIPSRWKAGYLYLPKEYFGPPYVRSDGFLDLKLMRHTWPEFYLPEFGWIVVDPTYTAVVKVGNRYEKVLDWNKFAKIEASSRHIFFNYGSYDGEYIEYRYSGPNPKVEFAEFLEFGNNVSPYKDIINHWARYNILFLSNYTPRIIGGYGNGLFGPNDNVTRAQAASMLSRALALSPVAPKPDFTDISNHWAYNDIAAVRQAGIIGGYPDKTFRPNQPLSRAELAAILVRAYNLHGNLQGLAFKDLGKSGYAWADASILLLAANGIASGYEGNLFKPERFVTRAEFATFLARTINPALRNKQ